MSYRHNFLVKFNFNLEDPPRTPKNGVKGDLKSISLNEISCNAFRLYFFQPQICFKIVYLAGV